MSGERHAEAQGDVGGGVFRVPKASEACVLRPEFAEALFYLWRATHNAKYREWGWQVFRSIEMHARLPHGGYSSIVSVLKLPVTHKDSMESFFLAETLKYLLLLFSDDSVRSPAPLAIVVYCVAHAKVKAAAGAQWCGSVVPGT